MADSRTYLCEIIKVDAGFLISLKDVIAAKIKCELTDIVVGNDEKLRNMLQGNKILFAFRTRQMPEGIGVVIKNDQFAFVGNNQSGQHSYLKSNIVMMYLREMILRVFMDYGFELINEERKGATFATNILVGKLQIKMHIDHDNNKVRFEYEGGHVRFNVVILEVREILEQKGIKLFKPELWI